MKIANIIYGDELINHTKVPYINYIKESKTYNDLDSSLPTLYVGWSFMKECNLNNNVMENANILKKHVILNKLYWEFSFIENKASHVKGINMFADLAPQYYFTPNYEYINLDPVFNQIKTIEDFISLLPNKFELGYNYRNEAVYLLSDNKIYGINLKMFEYFKFRNIDILIKIQSKTKSMISDYDGSYYQSYYKKFPNFPQLKRYIVTMLSK
jgi:hypothetical protein